MPKIFVRTLHVAFNKQWLGPLIELDVTVEWFTDLFDHCLKETCLMTVAGWVKYKRYYEYFFLHTFTSVAFPTNGTGTFEICTWNGTLSFIVTWIGQTWISLWMAIGRRKHQRNISCDKQHFHKQENAREKHRFHYIGPSTAIQTRGNPWSIKLR